MHQGVKYFIKHSGQFLYKISNEESLGDEFKITKIRLPEEIKQKSENNPKLSSEIFSVDDQSK
jgi:hypothetical protein